MISRLHRNMANSLNKGPQCRCLIMGTSKKVHINESSLFYAQDADVLQRRVQLPYSSAFEFRV